MMLQFLMDIEPSKLTKRNWNIVLFHLIKPLLALVLLCSERRKLISSENFLSKFWSIAGSCSNLQVCDLLFLTDPLGHPAHIIWLLFCWSVATKDVGANQQLYLAIDMLRCRAMFDTPFGGIIRKVNFYQVKPGRRSKGLPW